MKRILSISLSVLLILNLFSLNLNAYAASSLPSKGKCSDNISYTYSNKSGTITFYGKGEFPKKSKALKPFNKNSKAIKRIVFKDGITDISNYRFSFCKNLKSVYLSDSIVNIGQAFQMCYSLQNIRLSKNLESIEPNAFEYDRKLKKIAIPSKCIVKRYALSESGIERVIYEKGSSVIPHQAFYQSGVNYSGPKELYIPKSMKVIWVSGNHSDDIYFEGSKNEFEKIDFLYDSSDEGFESTYNVFPDYNDLGRIYYDTSLSLKTPRISKLKRNINTVTVNVKKAKVKGYEIEYGSDAYFRNNTEIKTSNKPKFLIKNVKSNKLYVRVRTFKIIKGKKQYSRWCKIKNV